MTSHDIGDWEEYETIRGDEPQYAPRISVHDGGHRWLVYEGESPVPFLNVDKDQAATKHEAWKKGYQILRGMDEEKFNGLSDKDAVESDVGEVNAPEHYTVGGYEAIDVIRSKLTQEEFRGYCKGNILKYLMRANYKGHHDVDCFKAEWYMEELSNEIQVREEDS